MTVPDCYWTIHSTDLFEALTRARAGEDPEMIYMELYANSESEDVSGDDPTGE